MDEAPLSWQAYRQALDGYKIVGHFDKRDLTGKQLETRSYSLIRNGEWWQSVSQDRVQSINSLYGFALTRKPGEQPWTLQQLILDWPEQSPDELKSTRYIFRYRENLPPGVMPWRYSFHEMMQDPAFSITDAQLISDNGRQLCKVDFQVDTDEPLVPGTALRPEIMPPAQQSLAYRRRDVRTVRSGTVAFRMEPWWLIAHADLNCEWPTSGETAKVAVKYQYAESNSFVLPHTCTIDVSTLAPGPGFIEKLEWTYEKYAAPREYDFKLSAFGLPEPTKYQTSRWWLWLIILGLLAFSLPYLIKRWKKPSTQFSPPVPSPAR